MTIELLLIAIYSAIIAVTIIDVAQIMEWLKIKLYRIRFTKNSIYVPYSIKPLDCGRCSAFWGTIIYTYIWMVDTPLIYIFIAGCISALIATALRKYIII